MLVPENEKINKRNGSMFGTVVQQQREYFSSGETLPVESRIKALKKLKGSIEQNEKGILEALYRDLRKSETEAYSSEVALVMAEIEHAMRGVAKWAKPTRVKTPRMHFPGKSFIYPEPVGVALILSPWNYPFQLLLAPLVGAIAAGNCAVLKPSEYAPHVSSATAELIRGNFGEEYIAVVEGGVEVAEALLQEKFDHIFFTGSTAVGKIVMNAASRHLTPVTLELGGKSPCVVWDDAKLEIASKRIVWGKFLNAGQTCVAPDYVLVHKDIREGFVNALIEAMKSFYGPSAQYCKDYARIINGKHFERLVGYLNDGRVVFGGMYDESDLYIAPTLLDSVNESSAVMQDEIFGPILPILEVETIDEAIDRIQSKPKPLALYLFTNDPGIQDLMLRRTSTGGVCINDTISHMVGTYLPFGGVGESGFGSYHGKAGFDCFSHNKSVLKKGFLFDTKLRYPPYNVELRKLRKLLKLLLK